MRFVAYDNWRVGKAPGSPPGTPSWSFPRAVPADSNRGRRTMAALARPHEIPVTPQKRGSCDASIKRLERGTFRFPAATTASETKGVEVQAADLMMLLDGVDLSSVRRRRRYERQPA